MARPLLLVHLLFSFIARAEFIPEVMPRPATNIAFTTSIAVSSNFVAFAATTNSFDPPAVYLRPKPGAEKPFQVICPAGATAGFGSQLLLLGDTLMVKDNAALYFYRQGGDTFIDDGKLDRAD